MKNGFTSKMVNIVIQKTNMASILSVNVRNFTPSKISFVQGIAKNNRVPPINMKYGDDEKNKSAFQILLPQAPVRLLTRTDDKTGETSYTLSYTLTGCDNYGRERGDDSTDMGKLYNSLLDLEEMVVKAAVENSAKWFGKKRSEEGIRESFKKIVRVSSDYIDGEAVPNGKYPPSWWIKIPVYDGKVSIDKEGIVDNRGNPVYATPESLQSVFPNNSQAKLAVTGNVYVMAGGGFGLTWKLRAAQVFPTSRVKAADLFGYEEETPQTSEAVEKEPETSQDGYESPTPAPTPAPAPSAPARKKRAPAGQ
jgi:hypothetical protein